MKSQYQFLALMSVWVGLRESIWAKAYWKARGWSKAIYESHSNRLHGRKKNHCFLKTNLIRTLSVHSCSTGGTFPLCHWGSFFLLGWNESLGWSAGLQDTCKKNPTEVSSFKSTVFMAGIVDIQILSVSWHPVALCFHITWDVGSFDEAKAVCG